MDNERDILNKAWLLFLEEWIMEKISIDSLPLTDAPEQDSLNFIKEIAFPDLRNNKSRKQIAKDLNQSESYVQKKINRNI